MFRRMITQLIIAQLIPVALKMVKKAFRKKKPPVEPKANLETANLEDVTDRSDQ
ncbi:MAG: hypothetical protein ABJ275_02075 [Maricaulaceae bacterium]